MRRIHLTNTGRSEIRTVLLILLTSAVLIAFATGIVQAQDGDLPPQTVTAINEYTCGNQILQMTLEVWNVGSDGGEAYGEAVIKGYDCINGKASSILKEQYGSFSGGPDGIASFSQGEFQFVDGTTVQYAPTGQVVFTVINPEAFNAVIKEAITSEYIYNTYGIRVQDSFGDDQWAQTSWSDQELILLNDVLKELPAGMIKEMAISRIIRNTVSLDKDGNPQPGINGSYFPCGSPPEKDCNSTSGTIRIFDNALNGGLFSNDPQGIKKFKGVILHELIHALQYKKDDTSIYSNQKYSYYNGSYSPLLQNYMDAIRPVTNINDPGFNNVDNGWFYGHYPQQADQWYLLGSTGGNTPPTNYGLKNPKEDMCDSVMMYVYEPQKLKDSSMQRYNFIRDQIYGGIEYENGIQKKP